MIVPPTSARPRSPERPKHLSHGQGIEQPAQPHAAEQQADDGVVEIEPVVQVGPDEGEPAVEQKALDRDRHEDDPRPRPAQQDQIGLDQRRRAARIAQHRRRHAARAQLDHQQAADQQEQAAEQEEDAAPADQIAEHAARGLAGDDAEDRAGHEPPQHRLTLLVRHVVADEGQRQRHDRRRGGASDQPRGAERGERVGKAGERHRHGREQRHERDQPVLADAVAERAPDQLAEAVGDREGGRDHRRVAEAHVELLGDLRDQRVGDAHGGDRGERRGTQDDNRPNDRSAAHRLPGASRTQAADCSKPGMRDHGRRSDLTKHNRREGKPSNLRRRGAGNARPARGGALPGTPPKSTAPPPLPLSTSRQKA